MKFFRRTAGYTLLVHKRHEEIFEELKLETVDEDLRRYKSNWLRHVTRMNSDRIPKISRLKHSFILQHGHYSNPAAPNLQHTTNREQNNGCGNSTAKSQAPDDGYINVRNMLST